MSRTYSLPPFVFMQAATPFMKGRFDPFGV